MLLLFFYLLLFFPLIFAYGIWMMICVWNYIFFNFIGLDVWMKVSLIISYWIHYIIFLILFYRLSKQLSFDDNLILSNQLMWMHLGCVRVYVSISITHTLNPYVYLKLKAIVWLTYAILFILNKEMDYFTLTWLIQAKFKNWSSLCL